MNVKWLSADRQKDSPDVIDQKVGCLHGGESRIPTELGPVHDVVLKFCDVLERSGRKCQQILDVNAYDVVSIDTGNSETDCGPAPPCSTR